MSVVTTTYTVQEKGRSVRTNYAKEAQFVKTVMTVSN